MVAEPPVNQVPDINFGGVEAAPFRLIICCPVNVFAPRMAAVPLTAGPVNVVPSIRVRVAAVAGAVRVSLFMLVAEATPSTGVVSVTNVPFVVAPVMPPNAPALLYCN